MRRTSKRNHKIIQIDFSNFKKKFKSHGAVSQSNQFTFNERFTSLNCFSISFAAGRLWRGSVSLKRAVLWLPLESRKPTKKITGTNQRPKKVNNNTNNQPCINPRTQACLEGSKMFSRHFCIVCCCSFRVLFNLHMKDVFLIAENYPNLFATFTAKQKCKTGPNYGCPIASEINQMCYIQFVPL